MFQIISRGGVYKPLTPNLIMIDDPIHKFIVTLNDKNSTKEEIKSQWDEIRYLFKISYNSSITTDAQKEYLQSIQRLIKERLYWK